MDSRWFRRFTPDSGDGPRLVCLPHAGGSATAYAPLARALGADVDVVAVQYPGRQERWDEEPFTAMTPLVEAVAGELARAVAAEPGRPYALFGHSMGAVVAWETARVLERRGLPLPRRVFLSGRGAPQARHDDRRLALDDAALTADVHRLGGTDQSLLDDPDVLELLLPVLRADYRALASYRWHGGAPITPPITALIGDDDPVVSVAEAGTWRGHTGGGFALEVFSGGHFYLSDAAVPVAGAVLRGLPVRVPAS